ncbi:MAG: DNA/RNA nuclease SfsA [Hyphomicrobiaceae bacterium]
MRFPRPLLRGRLERRYKRFLADVVLDDGRRITAACPNTGSMLGLCVPGTRVWLSESDNPARKYPHTWEMVEADLGEGPTLVGINPMHPNKLVREAIVAGRIAPLKGFGRLKTEQRYGEEGSRIDLLLEDDAKGRAYVEVKNVHLMRRPGCAEFPDSVTERGAKHLRELAWVARQGARAVLVFLVQRSDAQHLSLAADIDPAYAATFRAAAEAGVEALAYRCRLTPEDITVERKIPLRIA